MCQPCSVRKREPVGLFSILPNRPLVYPHQAERSTCVKYSTNTNPSGADHGQNGHHSDPIDTECPYNNIPAPLMALEQWIAAKLVPRNDGSGKDDKVPYDPHRPNQKASTTNAGTWASYDKAMAVVAGYDYDGPGFGAHPLPYAGLDLDDCVVDGKILPWAQALIDRCHTYTEFSVSGKGVKLIGRGSLPGAVHKHPYQGGAVEMYDRGRDFHLTGLRVSGTPAAVNDISDALAKIHHEVWGSDTGDSSDGGDRCPVSTDSTPSRTLAQRAWPMPMYSTIAAATPTPRSSPPSTTTLICRAWTTTTLSPTTGSGASWRFI